MVGVVLEAGVDDAVVRGDEGVLVAAVEVHAVRVEEEAVPGHGSVISDRSLKRRFSKGSRRFYNHGEGPY